MKKGLLILIIMFFGTAVYADVTFSITGDAWERGDFIRNQAFLDKVLGATPVNTSQAFYDGAFFLYPKLTIDKAEINMKLDIRQEDWDSQEPNGATNPSETLKNNLWVERAYITYHFTENSTLDVGLQEGGAWGSTFSDFQGNFYRIVYAQKTPVGLYGALLEKMAEAGNNPDKPDQNKNDGDDYALFGITKVGDVWVHPLLYYINWSSGLTESPFNGLAPAKIFYFALELNGNLGPVSFDSEFGFKNYKFTDTGAQEAISTAELGAPTTWKDSNTWGLYVNVFKTLDVAKPGITLVYDSWDKNGGLRNPVTGDAMGWGFDSGNDFKSNLIFGGKGVDSENPISAPLGENKFTVDYTDGQDMMAFTMIKPYVADIWTPLPNLTANASFSYMFSNQKDTMWDGAKAYEVDFGVAYQLAKNVVYSIEAGYGKCTLSSTGKTDAALTGVTKAPISQNPDAIYAIQHMIKITF